jgi:hypothetical protein
MLDRRLAGGVVPETGRLLAVRAGTLVRPLVRRRLARSLRGIVQEAVCPRQGLPGILSAASRRQINDAVDILAELADRLESACPVSSCGVARVNLLLTDGAGPLYYPARDDELQAAARAAIEAMNAPMLP